MCGWNLGSKTAEPTNTQTQTHQSTSQPTVSPRDKRRASVLFTHHPGLGTGNASGGNAKSLSSNSGGLHPACASAHKRTIHLLTKNRCGLTKKDKLAGQGGRGRGGVKFWEIYDWKKVRLSGGGAGT